MHCTQALQHHDDAGLLGVWRAARGVTVLGLAAADATTRGGMRFNPKHRVYIGYRQDGQLPHDWKPRTNRHKYLIWMNFYPQLTLLRDWVTQNFSISTPIRTVLEFLEDRMIGVTYAELEQAFFNVIRITTMFKRPVVQWKDQGGRLDHVRIKQELRASGIDYHRSPTHGTQLVDIHPNDGPAQVLAPTDADQAVTQALVTALIDQTSREPELAYEETSESPAPIRCYVPGGIDRDALVTDTMRMILRQDAYRTDVRYPLEFWSSVAKRKEKFVRARGLLLTRSYYALPTDPETRMFVAPSIHARARLIHRMPKEIRVRFHTVIGDRWWGLDGAGWWTETGATTTDHYDAGE